MWKSITSILVLSVIAMPVAAQPAKEWSPMQMMQVKRISGVQVSPDGKRVVYAVKQAVLDGGRSEYLTHIYLFNADGSDTFQLTTGAKSCDDPQWSPDGNWIAFGSRKTSKRNLWVMSPDGKNAVQLTDMKTDVTSFKWSPDSLQIAFTAKDAPTEAEEKARKDKNDARVVDENIKMSRLHVVTFVAEGKQKARVLTSGNYSVNATGRAGYDWSPDSKTIAFSHTKTPHADDWPSADISLVNVETAKAHPLVSSNAAEYSPHFSPDGKWIAYVASDDPPTWAGSGRILVVPVGKGESFALSDTADGFGRFSELLGWSRHGESVYFTEAKGTFNRLGAVSIGGTMCTLQGSIGVASGGMHLNTSRTRIGFSWENLHEAPEAHFIRLDGKKPLSLSKVTPTAVSKVNADLPKLPLGETAVIRWKSKDGLDIEGLLTYPANYKKGQRYPLLLNVHGGPAGVFTQTYVASPGLYPIASFSARGYAVLRPNPRGSSGYGKKFRYANYGDWGGGDFQDLMTGVDHVIKLGVADENRLGVMGWSYGGFMTSWTITQTKRFKAASVGAGVTNLMSFSGTADIPSFLPDYFGGEFWDKPDAYRKHSAMFNVKGVTTPTLIQHGERDERVPLSQGLELYNALKRQGCTTKMVIYPRTPHGIEEPRLLVDCMERNLEWFDKYLAK